MNSEMHQEMLKHFDQERANRNALGEHALTSWLSGGHSYEDRVERFELWENTVRPGRNSHGVSPIYFVFLKPSTLSSLFPYARD